MGSQGVQAIEGTWVLQELLVFQGTMENQERLDHKGREATWVWTGSGVLKDQRGCGEILDILDQKESRHL